MGTSAPCQEERKHILKLTYNSEKTMIHILLSVRPTGIVLWEISKKEHQRANFRILELGKQQNDILVPRMNHSGYFIIKLRKYIILRVSSPKI